MNMQLPIQYKNSLDYRSRLLGMKSVANETLQGQDLQSFLSSLQPMIDSVNREIEEFEKSFVTALQPTWTVLGEFVVEARILPTHAENIVWSATDLASPGQSLASYVDMNQLPLFNSNAWSENLRQTSWCRVPHIEALTEGLTAFLPSA